MLYCYLIFANLTFNGDWERNRQRYSRYTFSGYDDDSKRMVPEDWIVYVLGWMIIIIIIIVGDQRG